MIKLNVYEAKTHPCYYLQKLKRGETILLCRRNVPIQNSPFANAPQEQTTDRIGKGEIQG